MTQEQFMALVSNLTQVNNYIQTQCAAHKNCEGCPLAISTKNNVMHLCDIGDLNDEQIMQLVELMLKNPTNTRLAALLDKYPKTALHYKTKLPYFCCGEYFNFKCPHNISYDMFNELCQRCYLEPTSERLL